MLMDVGFVEAQVIRITLTVCVCAFEYIKLLVSALQGVSVWRGGIVLCGCGVSMGVLGDLEA